LTGLRHSRDEEHRAYREGKPKNKVRELFYSNLRTQKRSGRVVFRQRAVSNHIERSLSILRDSHLKFWNWWAKIP